MQHLLAITFGASGLGIILCALLVLLVESDRLDIPQMPIHQTQGILTVTCFIASLAYLLVVHPEERRSLRRLAVISAALSGIWLVVILVARALPVG